MAAFGRSKMLTTSRYLKAPRRLRAFVRAHATSLVVLAALAGTIGGWVVLAMSVAVAGLHAVLFNIERGSSFKPARHRPAARRACGGHGAIAPLPTQRNPTQCNRYMSLISKEPMRRLLTVMVAILLGLGWSGMGAAQNYPARAITMIVPFPAGGATDTLARFLAEKMRGILGQPVIIENIAGAAGSIGVGRAVRSPADGYTLSIGTSTSHMRTGGLYALQFDLLKDL